MQKKRFQEAFDKLSAFFPEEGKVLDLDYGHGEYTQLFEEKDLDVIAIDPQGYSRLDTIPETREMVFTPVAELSLPYRTINVIWAKDTLITLSKEELSRYLSQFIDWLNVGGVMHFCLLEGEGYKIMQQQLPTGISTIKHYYYSPVEVEMLIQQAGGRTIDAWYEQLGGKQWIHILVQRK